VKKLVVIPFFCSHKFHKIENYFIFEMPKKKIWASFQRIILLLPKRLSLSSKIWVWDPGSGKNLSRIPDPGVKKATDPGSGSATLGIKPCSSARKASPCAPSLDTSLHFQIKTFPALSELLGVGEMFLVFGGVAFLCLLWGVSTD
jgi:hypothetical protein